MEIASFVEDGKGRCLASFTEAMWFVCAGMYFTDTGPCGSATVTNILDKQKSFSFREVEVFGQRVAEDFLLLQVFVRVSPSRQQT